MTRTIRAALIAAILAGSLAGFARVPQGATDMADGEGPALLPSGPQASEMVPTVERWLVEIVFWSMEMAGEMPSTDTTSGFSIWSMNWRA